MAGAAAELLQGPLKTSPGFSAPVWTQHYHWFPRSCTFRSAQISAVADGSPVPARMAWWSSHAEHWHPVTPARAIWRTGYRPAMGCLVPASSGPRKPLLLTQSCRCFCCPPGGGVEKSGFLLTGCTSLTSRYMMPTDVWWLVLDTESASHIERKQGRGEQLAVRAGGDCVWGLWIRVVGRRCWSWFGQSEAAAESQNFSLFLWTIYNCSLQLHLAAPWKYLPQVLQCLICPWTVRDWKQYGVPSAWAEQRAKMVSHLPDTKIPVWMQPLGAADQISASILVHLLTI